MVSRVSRYRGITEREQYHILPYLTIITYLQKNYMLNLRKVRILLSICIWQLTAVPFLAAAAKSPQQTVVAQNNSAPSLCPGQLAAEIDAIVSRPQFRRQRWGILIQPLFSSQTLYSRDAEKIFRSCF